MGLEEKIASSAYLYDVIVIGGGVAGYSCALNAKAWGMKVAFIEQLIPGGTVRKYLVKDYLGFNKIKGKDLVLKMFEQLQSNGVEYLYGNVISLSQRDGYQVIGTEDKLTRYAKAVIVATGTKELELEIPGFKKYSDFIYSEISNLFFNIKGKRILFFGNNKNILDYTSLFSKEAKSIDVINPFNDFDNNTLSRFDNIENVKIHKNVEIKQLLGNEKKLESCELINGNNSSKIDIDFIFMAFDNYGNSEFIENKKILNPNGMITINNNFETTIDGLYAIGSITNIENRFLSMAEAIGQGSQAAFNACKYIRLKWK